MDPHDNIEDEETQLIQTQTDDSSQLITLLPVADPTTHWAYLQRLDAKARIFLHKHIREYKVGRRSGNDIHFPGFKISNNHATITWDGNNKADTCITITDYSSNGTFVNNRKIDRSHTHILHHGDEIAFGTAVRDVDGNNDYRFTFNIVAGGNPEHGMYAHYDQHNELGRGSFASVFRVLHKASGQFFAAKIIREVRVLGDDSFTADQRVAKNRVNFLREISIMEKLEHPNICKLKETFFHDNGDICLILELVPGKDLLESIIDKCGLDEPAAKDIAYQICDALAYIHSTGVAHRDLKPENILLTRDQPPIVKIADFGLAKVADSMTMLKTMCGTPGYLAPEVVMQDEVQGYSHLVDSWSVGIIIFCIFSNSNPFIEDPDEREIRTRIQTRTIDWPCLRVHREVSLEAEDCIRKLLTWDPEHRLTMAGAKEHIWLKGYVPHFKFDNIGRPMPSDGSAYIIPAGEFDEDVVMGQSAGTFGEVFNNLNINSKGEVPGTPPSQSQGGSGSQGAPARGLQRRAKIVAMAAEGDGELPTPDAGMLARFHNLLSNDRHSSSDEQPAASGSGLPRQESELTPVPETPRNNGQLLGDASMMSVVAEGNGNAGSEYNGKGPNKRGHSDMSDAPEDDSPDEDDMITSPRKRKAAKVVPVTTKPSVPARGKAPPKGKKVQAPAVTPAEAPRRSGRNAGKK